MKPMQKYLILVILATALLALQDGFAYSQSNEDPYDKVQKELETTQEILVLAQKIVMESSSLKGRFMLDHAKLLQDQALDNFSSSLRNTLKLTLEARQLAYQAIALVRQEMKTEVRIQRILEETNDRMAKVRDEIIEHNIKANRIIKLLDEARNLMEKSKLESQQHRYQLSLKLAESARSRTLQAEQFARRIRVIKGTVERRLALMEKLYERAAEQINEQDNEQARNQLHLVEQQMVHTKQLLAEHRYQAAKISLENFEKTFRNLIRQIPSQNMNNPETMLEEAYRLLARAEEMSGRAAEAAQTKQQGYLDQAKRLLTRAGDELAEKRNERALRLINEARTLLHLSVREKKQEMTKERVKIEIQKAETMRDEVQNAAEACDAPGIQTLLDRAASRIGKAWQMLEAGELPNAEAEARIARNLYQRIREICGTS
jgi:hypothetical protein